MVWMLEKKVFHHILDLGYEGVAIPIRVKFEFEIRDGRFVTDSLAYEPLYNRDALLNRYPNLDAAGLDENIVQTVENEINAYLERNGYLKATPDSDTTT